MGTVTPLPALGDWGRSRVPDLCPGWLTYLHAGEAVLLTVPCVQAGWEVTGPRLGLQMSQWVAGGPQSPQEGDTFPLGVPTFTLVGRDEGKKDAFMKVPTSPSGRRGTVTWPALEEGMWERRGCERGKGSGGGEGGTCRAASPVTWPLPSPALSVCRDSREPGPGAEALSPVWPCSSRLPWPEGKHSPARSTPLRPPTDPEDVTTWGL